MSLWLSSLWPFLSAMLTILNVIAPVFILLGLGYLAVRLRYYPREGVRGLIAFVNYIAAPCLLFRAMLTVDLSTAFDLLVIAPFFVGAGVVFVLALLLARLFGRTPEEAVVMGFTGMFSNCVLLGIPILQRAYGEDAMPVVYSIIGLHSPILITGSLLAMELARRDGSGIGGALVEGLRKVVANPFLIGIALGLLANLSGLTLPEPVDVVTWLIASSVMPVALFGLGGALVEYRLADNWHQALSLAVLKLVIQPGVAFVLMVPILGVPLEIARYAVLLSTMPTGLNAYIFATYYNRATDLAANAILLSTGFSLLSISLWLMLLGGV